MFRDGKRNWKKKFHVAFEKVLISFLAETRNSISMKGTDGSKFCTSKTAPSTFCLAAKNFSCANYNSFEFTLLRVHFFQIEFHSLRLILKKFIAILRTRKVIIKRQRQRIHNTLSFFSSRPRGVKICFR